MNLFEGNPVYEMLNRAKSISDSDIFVQIFSMDNVQLFASNLNRNQLRNNFENSEGVQLSNIGGNYSPYTIQLSIQEGRPKKGSSSIDLYHTGEFQASIRVTQVDGTGFVMDANPQKDDTNLFLEWGENIVGLTAESISQLVEMVLPLYRDAVLKFILNA